MKEEITGENINEGRAPLECRRRSRRVGAVENHNVREVGMSKRGTWKSAGGQ